MGGGLSASRTLKKMPKNGLFWTSSLCARECLASFGQEPIGRSDLGALQCLFRKAQAPPGGGGAGPPFILGTELHRWGGKGSV